MTTPPLELVFTADYRRPATPAEEAVHAALQADPPRDLLELARACEVSIGEASRAMANLSRAGLVDLGPPIGCAR